MTLLVLCLSSLIGFSSNVIENKALPTEANLMCSVYERVNRMGVDLSEDIFRLAFTGFQKLSAQGRLSRDSILTIIDYSRSSKEKRMFVIDLRKQELLFHSLVAHGRNSGDEFAQHFSNDPNSHQSSLGFFITGDTYFGSNGYSMKLNGTEKGINDRALPRAIVMHGAWYANEQVIQAKGYLGRSWGCPAIPEELNNKVIERIKKGNCLFIYYPDQRYLRTSSLLNG